jgi:hypothetical protein
MAQMQTSGGYHNASTSVNKYNDLPTSNVQTRATGLKPGVNENFKAYPPMSLEDKRYHAPLHLLHVLAVAGELLLEHCFLANTTHRDRDDHNEAHYQTID